jgi:proteasome lid subunit RPN8/RPN11
LKIKKTALEFILGVSKEVYPNEFGGMLRGRGDTIEEVMVIPATTYGETFVTTRMDMVPFDKSIIGSVHSHPVESFRPSGADLESFRKTGRIHLIVKKPYKSIQDIAAYDAAGNRIKLEIG